MTLFGHAFVGSRHKRPQCDLTKMPRASTKRRAVLRIIAKTGKRGITDEELGCRLVLTPSEIQKARLELIDGNWVEDSTKKRKTSFGDDAVVWRLTAVGLEKWKSSEIK